MTGVRPLLSKILIGTANFVNPYGIMSKGLSLPAEVIQALMTKAKMNGVSGLDTAYAYGDISKVLPISELTDLRVVTKISVLDAPNDIAKQLKSTGIKYYGILIHDPQNLSGVSKEKIVTLMTHLKAEFPETKLGISAYEPDEVYDFSECYIPELIQIPLNPFNQIFNSTEFRAFAQDNGLVVHARSLFLQGILLANTLPAELAPIEPHWRALKEQINENALSTILAWAMAQELVDAWVLGVSCENDLDQIIAALSQVSHVPDFQPVDHPLINPKNWTFLS